MERRSPRPDSKLASSQMGLVAVAKGGRGVGHLGGAGKNFLGGGVVFWPSGEGGGGVKRFGLKGGN